MAFAAGKVLLFGEHSVVHGHPAVAAALELGVTAKAVEGPLSVTCADWGLAAAPGDGSKVGAAIENLVAALPFDGATVTFTSTVPPGAGLGSSAAMAVAIARSLADLRGVSLTNQQLFDAALASERVFHGNPSGLDHAVAIRGGMIAFSKATDPPTVRLVETARAMRLLIAQVSPGADTGKMVAGVAAQRERLGHVAVGLHEQIHAVAVAGMEALGRGDAGAVGELMNVNHGLLGSIGVSTPELDAACHLARGEGALGAKLTGAGGGGCVIALVEDGDKAVAPALVGAGHTVYSTTIGKR